MVISLCARSHAKRIFPRNSNIVFSMKKGEKGKIFGNRKKEGISKKKGGKRRKK